MIEREREGERGRGRKRERIVYEKANLYGSVFNLGYAEPLGTLPPNK